MKTADKLRKFRQACEKETGHPAERIELPLSHVLADICAVLKLPARTQRKVIGRKTYVRLETLREHRVEVKSRD
jgi:hypothetical protein